MKLSKLFSNYGFPFILLIVISSMQLQASSNENNRIDSLAEQFVKLGLELGVYDKDYVDAYLGPKKWSEDAKKHPRTKKQLAVASSKLLHQLQLIKVNDEKTTLRIKSLFKNVRAMDTRIRMLNGEKFSFKEEAKLIYDAVVPTYDFKEFDNALAEIDKLIPGNDPLSERVENFKKSFLIPDSSVEKVVAVAINECRKRTYQHIKLPADEHFTLEYVTDKNWGGYNWYQGKNNSLMQINQDFPMEIGRAIELGCHEGYPGHHVWNLLVENNLLGANNWIEFSIFPLFSPYGLIAEGSANYGVDLAFPGSQKMIYERDVLFPLAGLDPKKAKSLHQLNILETKLSHATTAIAQLYLNDKISRDEAIAKIQKYRLVSKKRAIKSLGFIEQYRAYVINYTLGKDIVQNYIEQQGDNENARWKAFEKMLTELSTASDMVQ